MRAWMRLPGWRLLMASCNNPEFERVVDIHSVPNGCLR